VAGTTAMDQVCAPSSLWLSNYNTRAAMDTTDGTKTTLAKQHRRRRRTRWDVFRSFRAVLMTGSSTATAAARA
jgi:hypothetical protein